MSCLEGFEQTRLLSFPIRCGKDKGILGWRIYLHLKHGKLIHCLLNVLAITWVLFYLKASCQSVRWEERECQGRPWCAEARRLPGAFVTISKWVWGFTGLHLFLCIVRPRCVWGGNLNTCPICMVQTVALPRVYGSSGRTLGSAL